MIIRGNNIHLQNSKNNALLRSGANDNSLDNFFVQVHYLYRRKAVVLWAITGALCCLCYYYVCFTIDQSESFEEHGGMLRSLAESSSSSTKPRSRHYLIKVDKAKKQYRRAEFTMDDFPVAGVNLGKYGFAEELEVNSSAPFELFADFDISEFITGNESWSDLVNYRRELKRPSISF